MPENTTPPKRVLYRASILYTGKFTGKTECAFIRATSQEEAEKYVDEMMKASLKKSGFPEDCFKVLVSRSSKGEVDFYTQNRFSQGYTGVLN